MLKREFKGRSLAGAKNFRNWKEYTEGDCLIGTIETAYEDKYGKINAVIRVEENWFADKKDFSGKSLAINSCGSVDFQWKSLLGLSKNDELDVKSFNSVIGTRVQITFDGRSVMETGKYKGKEYSQVSILVDTSEEQEHIEL